MATTIATTGGTATRPWNIVGTVTIGCTAGNERRDGRSHPLLTAALYGLQNLQRLDNDLSVSERHRVLGSRNGSGNLTDLTAFL
jgi:hypothetical protein